jgi:hypothetical protein
MKNRMLLIAAMLLSAAGESGEPGKGTAAAPPETNPTPAAVKAAQVPSVGRVVHYWPPGCGGKKKQPYPAVITHVQADGSVNLGVAQDGEHRLDDVLPCRVEQRKAEGHEPSWDWPPRG